MAAPIVGRHKKLFVHCRHHLLTASSCYSTRSRAGFNDYEKGRQDFVLDVPKHFNFARDIFDVWACKVNAGFLKVEN